MRVMKQGSKKKKKKKSTNLNEKWVKNWYFVRIACVCVCVRVCMALMIVGCSAVDECVAVDCIVKMRRTTRMLDAHVFECLGTLLLLLLLLTPKWRRTLLFHLIAAIGRYIGIQTHTHTHNHTYTQNHLSSAISHSIERHALVPFSMRLRKMSMWKDGKRKEKKRKSEEKRKILCANCNSWNL